ncbi:MAG: pyridoxamine 5'-phosphate oxidase family protein [Pseudomonadota bacterium]
MLTDQMRQIIRNFNAASVATVNDDGTPAVSPKATFVIIDDTSTAFGNIRSPNTEKNIRTRPAVELNFVDVLARRAVRVKGEASIVEKDSESGQALMPMFEELWAPYIDKMRNFIRVDVSRAQLVTSPAYDIGLGEQELVDANFEKIKGIATR